MSTLQILDEIGSNTTRSHKLSVIKAHTDNKTFMSVVKLALDPYVNFYVKKIPDYDPVGSNTLEWAIDELTKLSTRQLTGNAAIEHLRTILSSVSPDDAIVVSRIIGKDLRCGMADGIVNAAVPDFIPSYPCLLARPFEEKNIKNIKYPACSQKKGDGARINFHVSGNSVYACGRSGKPVELSGALDAEFELLGKQFNTPVVFDGELVAVDKNNKILPRTAGNGIISKAIRGTISEEETHQMRVMLWDVIPADEFHAGKSTQTYETRFNSLISAIETAKTAPEHTVNILKSTYDKYWVIPYKIVNNLDEAVEHFNEMLSVGEEGTVLKNMLGLWCDSRSKDLVKMKSEKSCDLVITGYTPGQGKFEGQIGSLTCASSDAKVEVNISGFSDEVRKHITTVFDTLKGTIVEVIYNERIKSKDKNRADVDSLFLPRFGCFRKDKLVADSTNEII